MLVMAPGTVKFTVAELLEKRQMTVGEMAKEAGMSYNTALAVSRNASTRIDLETLARICDALGVKVSDLLVYVAEE